MNIFKEPYLISHYKIHFHYQKGTYFFQCTGNRRRLFTSSHSDSIAVLIQFVALPSRNLAL